MTWRTFKPTRRLSARIAGAGAALALLAGAGQAQQPEPVAADAAEMLADNPASSAIFTPSAEAQFEEAFAHLPDPSLDPAIPEHAVDLSTIEPAEPATRNLGTGSASYYGAKFHGRRTASGATFDMHALTAAHRTLPFGSQVRVTNISNGRSVVVRVNDRGPFVRGREIDLSRAAAERIGIINAGHGNVEIELIVS